MRIDPEKRLIECSAALMVKVLQNLLPNDPSARARMERKVMVSTSQHREVFSFTSGAKLVATDKANVWRIKYRDPQKRDMESALAELKSANYSRLAADMMQESINYMRGMNNVEGQGTAPQPGAQALERQEALLG